MSTPQIAPLPARELEGLWATLRERIGAVIFGQDETLELCLVTLLVGGHALLQGPPGVAKTLLVRQLSTLLGVRFGRVQFTPDLMPSDVLGSPIFDAAQSRFEFRPGPIFTDLLLGDEINRAPAKTQAALLEAMQERHVTVYGESFPLGDDFTLFATQNPVEHEGTYPLPEAELDRFLFRIDLAYPSRDAERQMLLRHHAQDPEHTEAQALVSRATLAAARATVRGVTVREEIADYVLDLVRESRDEPSLALGGSPRAALWLLRAAKAVAALGGRDYVTPDDVQRVFLPAFRHRVMLEPSAEVEGISPDDALRQVLARVAVPH